MSEKGWLKHFLSTIDRVDEVSNTDDVAALVIVSREAADEIERLREALIDIRDNNWLSEIDGVAVGRSAHEIAANALTPTPEALP